MDSKIMKRDHRDPVTTMQEQMEMSRNTSRRKDAVPHTFSPTMGIFKTNSQECKEIDSDEEPPNGPPQFLEKKSVNSYFDHQSSFRREKEAKSCRNCVITHAREFFKLIGVVMGGPISAITYSEKLANIKSCECLEGSFRTIRAIGVILTQTIVIILVYMFTESETLQKVILVVSCTYTILYVTLMLIAEFESRTAVHSWNEKMWGKWLISQKLDNFVDKETEEPSFSNNDVKVSDVTTENLLEHCMENIAEYGREKNVEPDLILQAQTKVHDKLYSDYQPLRRKSRKWILAFFNTSVQDVTGSTSAWLIPSFCITISTIAAVFYLNIQITIDNDDNAFSTIARLITAGGLVYRVSSFFVQLIISVDYDCIELIYPSKTDLAIARKLVAPILKNLEENQIMLRGKLFNTTDQITQAVSLIHDLQEKVYGLPDSPELAKLSLPGQKDLLLNKIEKSKRELKNLKADLRKEWKSIGEMNRETSVLRKRNILTSKTRGSMGHITRTSPTGSNYKLPNPSGGRDSVQLTTIKSAPLPRGSTNRRGAQPDSGISLIVSNPTMSHSKSALASHLEIDNTAFTEIARTEESELISDFDNFETDGDLSPAPSDALTPLNPDLKRNPQSYSSNKDARHNIKPSGT